MNEEAPQKPLTISKAQDFKKQREEADKGETLELESGLIVRVKRPKLKKMITMGLMPDHLASVLVNIQDIVRTPKAGDLPKMMELQNFVALNTVIEPKVVEGEADYDKGEISLDDIDEIDMNTIWLWVNGGREAIDSFRNERQGVLTRPDSETLPKPTT